MRNERSSAALPESRPEAMRVDVDYQLVDLGRFVRLYWRRKKFLVLCGVAGAVLAYGVALLLHPAYEASVRLMPPSPQGSSQASLFLTRNVGDLTLGLISSRTVADDVIEHQHLADYFHTTKPSALRAQLGGMAKISVDKDQFVTVEVRAREPETALRVANEFPEALYRLNHSMAIAEAAHRREYFEVPLEQEKDRLAQAEEQLKQMQQKTGILAPQAQVQIGLTAIAELRQQIVGRREQLAALETHSTDRNAQVVELKSQIASLEGQLHRLEAQSGGVQSGGASAPNATMPELTLEVERLSREVKFHETLFEIISKQYENARVDQSYSPSVSLVDRATIPDQKVWPSRKLFFLIGLGAGIVLGFMVITFEVVQPVRRLHGFLQEPEGSGV